LVLLHLHLLLLLAAACPLTCCGALLGSSDLLHHLLLQAGRS
jgi:hypothetical protein